MSLETNLQNLATRVGTEFKAHRNLITGGAANLSDLNTTNKSSLVAAINELITAIGGAGAAIDDATISTLTVWSSSKTDQEIDAAVSALVSAAPGALDTLNELADALGDNPNFATDVTNLIGTKADSNNPVFTGTVTVPDGSLSIADTAGLQTALDGKITAFPDPNSDRIVFWDDSAGAFAALALSGMSISGTTLSNIAASETATGVVERATLAEVSTGTDSTRYVSPQGVRQEINTRAPLTHSHASTEITDFATAVPAAVPAATDAVSGKVELATVAETSTGTDTARAVTPAGVKAVADTKAALSHTHTASNITDFNSAAAAAVPSASETVQGKVELATVAEATTGTDAVRAVTPAGVKAVADTKAALSHTHTASNITDFSSSVDARVNTLIPNASDTVAGKVELATTTEATTGTDTGRAVTPAGLKAVADTKASSTHGHALTDANITGILPIAQIPVGSTASTVAVGNHTHTASGITDFNTAADARVNALVPSASQTVQGKIEIATDLEVATGTDLSRAVTPAGLRSITGNPEANLVAVFEAALV